MGEEVELKPCPFCGGTDLRVSTYDVQPDDYHSGYVRCGDCDTEGAKPGEWLSNEAEAHEAAIAAWNRRAALSTPAEERRAAALSDLAAQDAEEIWPAAQAEESSSARLCPSPTLCAAKNECPRVAEAEESSVGAPLDIATVRDWLREMPSLDMEDIAADGGVTVAMVVQQQAREMARRLDRALEEAAAHERYLLRTLVPRPTPAEARSEQAEGGR